MAHGCVAVHASVRKFWPGVSAASDSKVRDPLVALSLLTFVPSMYLHIGRLCCFYRINILNKFPEKLIRPKILINNKILIYILHILELEKDCLHKN